MIEKRGWEVAMLTDLNFGVNGARDYRTVRQTWTVIVQGLVGIALNEQWADKWRKSGAKVIYHGLAESGTTRSVAIEIDSDNR